MGFFPDRRLLAARELLRVDVAREGRSSQMLPKNRRIPRDTLKDTSRFGKSLNSQHFFLKVIPAPSGVARFSVSVSKKISKKAVVRNRTRRRIYSSIKASLLGIAPGLYILSAKTGVDRLKGEVLGRELNTVFSSFLK